MHIREARPEDNQALMDLQARCPQGRGLVTSLVNTPDFFARARAWPEHRVFTVHDGQGLMASGSCALAQALINGEPRRVGYQFEYFVDQRARRQGAARAMMRRIEEHLAAEGAELSYMMVMQGNLPSLNLCRSLGYQVHRDLTMQVLMVFREMKAQDGEPIRTAGPEDFDAAAELINRAWEGHDFHQPTSGPKLGRFLADTPGHSPDNLLILDGPAGPRACVGLWDWASITGVTVLSVTRRMTLTRLMLDLLGRFRPMPRMPRPGQRMRQWCLTSLGFEQPAELAALLARANNLALAQGVSTIFLLADNEPWVAEALAGRQCIQVGMHLLAKPLAGGAMPGNRPVRLDGIHL